VIDDTRPLRLFHTQKEKLDIGDGLVEHNVLEATPRGRALKRPIKGLQLGGRDL